MEPSLDQIIQLTKETIIVTAEEVLGDQAQAVIDRIRSAPNTPEALRDTVSQCHAMIESAVSAEQLESVSSICNALLRDLDEAVKENAKPAPTSEKQALKTRIVKAKLVAVTSGLLGADGLKIVSKLRSAPDTREGLLAVLQECESMADASFKDSIASELKNRCGEIAKQLS
jgi:hypothetical protein